MPPKPRETNPDELSIPGGGGRASSYDVGQKLGSIERSITYLEATSTDTAGKVDKLLLEFAEAKGSLRTFKWVVGIVGGALTLLWTFIAGIVTLAIKHYMGW